MVSETDESAWETVRKNFVASKLVVEGKDRALAAVNSVASRMSGIRVKSRPAFYNLVAQ